MSTLTALLLPFLLTALATAGTLGPVQGASFTWYNDCSPSHLPACGPTSKTIIGHGFAATNKINYEQGAAVINGIGKGCGTCWHLQPLTDPDPMNGNHFGGPVVVKINDECQDGGYCDQTVGGGGNVVGNTKYGKAMHFDLCTESGVAAKFFGDINQFGQLLGLAQQVDCAEMENGSFGTGLGTLDGSAPAPAAGATAASGGQSTTPSSSSAVSSPTSGGQIQDLGTRPISVLNNNAGDNSTLTQVGAGTQPQSFAVQKSTASKDQEDAADGGADDECEL